MESGKSKSSAIAIAVSRIRVLAAKGNAKAVRALAQWEALRAKNRAKSKVAASAGVREGGGMDGDVSERILAMSVLSTKARKQLKPSDFAIPEKRMYPVNDDAHCRNALTRVSQHGTPEEQRRVKAAVRRKCPNVDVGGEKKSKDKIAAAAELGDLLSVNYLALTGGCGSC